MASKLKGVDISHFLPHGAKYPIPMLRFYLEGDDQFDADVVLRYCEKFTLSFEPYHDPKKNCSAVESAEECFIVSSFGARKSESSEHTPWLRFSPVFSKDEARDFRNALEKAGIWWIHIRYNGAERFVSFTIDVHGSIISRHLMIGDEKMVTILEGQSYH